MEVERELCTVFKLHDHDWGGLIPPNAWLSVRMDKMLLSFVEHTWGVLWFAISIIILRSHLQDIGKHEADLLGKGGTRNSSFSSMWLLERNALCNLRPFLRQMVVVGTEDIDGTMVQQSINALLLPVCRLHPYWLPHVCVRNIKHAWSYYAVVLLSSLINILGPEPASQRSFMACLCHPPPVECPLKKLRIGILHIYIL